MTGTGKGKMMGLDEDADDGIDELLAAFGYNVRSSDMADVAEKLEQLEMVMVGSHLASDTVHYNPSDLSNWLESMLSELSAQAPASAHSSTAFFDPADALTTTESSTVTSVDFPAQPPPVVFPDFAARQSGSGGNRVVYGSEPQIDSGTRDRKRMKTSSSSSSSRGGSGGGLIVQSSPTIGSLLAPASGTEVSSALPVVMVDTQEVGIRLVHALMACAEAVHQENFKVADVLDRQITVLASSQGGAMRKVVGYFAEALARKIYRLHPQQDCSSSPSSADPAPPYPPPPLPHSLPRHFHHWYTLKPQFSRAERTEKNEPCPDNPVETQIVAEVMRIKEILINNQNEPDSILYDSLRTLQLMDLSVETLKATKIGRPVSALRKHNTKQIQKLAQTLVKDWKELVDQSVKSTAAITNNSVDSAKNLNEASIIDFGMKRKPSNSPQNNSGQSNEISDMSKLEIAKRKLVEGYQRIEHAKKQRMVKFIDLRDLPMDLQEKRRPKKKP
ncbi:hypothetical protein M5K25_013287 [Dendrobium thyrsiflorum]|uniref:TFIIS N-terminal domain-containing protein n=1 Tax=Dendrobium thyrsiflorum TaxID=117978 RepID=A0ABD0USI0_DENTH